MAIAGGGRAARFVRRAAQRAASWGFKAARGPGGGGGKVGGGCGGFWGGPSLWLLAPCLRA